MTTINKLFDCICNQGIPTGNDYVSGSMIISDINNRYIRDRKDATDFYIFNVNRAITYENDIVLKMLFSHPLLEVLEYSEYLKTKVINRILKTNNLRLAEAMFGFVEGSKESISGRLDFIENECPLSSPLNKYPLYGIFYDEYSQSLSDKLLNIEDILDDYAFFEEFTGINLNDPFLLDKIKAFLGNRMDFSDITFFLKLRDEFQQKM
jgi:hypothetical protein